MTEELLCQADEIDSDEPKKVTLKNGHALAVYNLDGEFFATDDLCSHGEASLSDGEIEDGLIICPFHLGSFCIKTGDAVGAPCTQPVKTYPLILRDGALYLSAE